MGPIGGKRRLRGLVFMIMKYVGIWITLLSSSTDLRIHQTNFTRWTFDDDLGKFGVYGNILMADFLFCLPFSPFYAVVMELTLHWSYLPVPLSLSLPSTYSSESRGNQGLKAVPIFLVVLCRNFQFNHHLSLCLPGIIVIRPEIQLFPNFLAFGEKRGVIVWAWVRRIITPNHQGPGLSPLNA